LCMLVLAWATSSTPLLFIWLAWSLV
jgi:hypothetical protein